MLIEKNDPLMRFVMNYFLFGADTTNIFCVSVSKQQWHFLRFFRSWNISDNTDKLAPRY